MLETNTPLVKCPHCGAWPMAANLAKPASALREPRLRCPKCHHQESVRLRRPATTQGVPHRPRDLDAA